MRKSKNKLLQGRNWHRIASMLVLFSLMTACGLRNARVEPYFIPPTVDPLSSPVVVQTATPPTFKSPTPDEPENCQNNLSFVADVTIEDFTEFKPGEGLEKVWQVKNSGNCNWKEDYTFKLVDGEAFGAELTQPLYPARSGAEVEIRIQMTAPQETGEYLSAWQAYDDNGNPFGEVIYTKFNVVE